MKLVVKPLPTLDDGIMDRVVSTFKHSFTIFKEYVPGLGYYSISDYIACVLYVHIIEKGVV